MAFYCRISAFLITFFLLSTGQAEAQEAAISGRVSSADGLGIPGINVILENTRLGAATGINGNYLINKIEPGNYKLIVSGLGFSKETRNVSLQPGENLTIDFTLTENVTEMEELVIRGETEAQLIKKEAYSLNVIDASTLRNSNTDVAQLLSRTTGINIREEGGLGADFDFSINGLSGKQVKFFLDGIPMDQFGTALSINNIPVNMIERIEVYKGVVPVHLGSDALGGAINIITRQSYRNYLDASYSFGSFNTHRASVNTRFTIPNTSLITELSTFYNYSDNDYRVDVEIPDELGNLDGTTTRVRRFHDQYRSTMGKIRIGVQGQSYADHLFVGFTYADNRNNLQHGVSMERVFGQVYTTDQMAMPSLEYRKDGLFNKKLNLNSYLGYIQGQYQVVDTSSRTYDWYGNYKLKNNPSIGESQWEKTLFNFQDKSILSNNNLQYQLSDGHELVLNHTFNHFQREGDDPLDPGIIPFSDPNILSKQVLGLSYQYDMMGGRWPVTVFSKLYHFRARSIDVDWDNTRTEINNEFLEPGYGLATTFHATGNLQLKFSYESAFRLPEGYEMFGDGLLLLNNPYLEPEKSQNLNLGLQFRTRSNHSALLMESNLFYRNSENLIRIDAAGVNSQYQNVSDANSSGVELEAQYQFLDHFTVGVNATYQHVINRTRLDEEGKPNYVYLDRIPNIPYLFGNLQLGYQHEDIFRKNDRLDVNWFSRYVHEYYLHWPSQGDPNNKHIIPTQLVHNIEASYALANNRYNLALGSTNLLDAMAYDKFRVQKPGRALYFKIRYFIY